MTTSNPRRITKPPRPAVGSLQKLPSYPWLFTTPLSSYQRMRLCRNVNLHGGLEPMPIPDTSCPYRRHWQFRDEGADFCLNKDPCLTFHDFRGGPVQLKNVVSYTPKEAATYELVSPCPPNHPCYAPTKFDSKRVFCSYPVLPPVDG